MWCDGVGAKGKCSPVFSVGISFLARPESGKMHTLAPIVCIFGLMVKCTPERGHNALFFIPLEVIIML